MGRAVGIDLGTRRIGVAVSDATGLIAQPHTTIARHGGARDLQAIAAVVQQVGASTVVLGLPLNPEADERHPGDEGRAARSVRAFAERLRGVLQVPIELVDESFTTVEAAEALRESALGREKRRALVDKVAAALILQRYLDAQPRRAS